MLLLFLTLLLHTTLLCNQTENITRSLGYVLYTQDSTTPLLAHQEYNSGPINISEHSQITVLLYGTPTHAQGTLYMEFSPDGEHWDRSRALTIKKLDNEPPHTMLPVSTYFRVRYVNGATDQTAFRLQTLFHKNAAKNLTATLEQEISTTTDVENVRAVVAGRNQAGNYENVLITSDNALAVDIKKTSAFGEVAVSEPTTIAQIQFTYGIHPGLMTNFTHNAGTISSQSNMIEINSGAASNSYAMALSTIPIKYNPGQGAFCRLSALFTQGQEGSTQYAGVGDYNNGLFFGYKDTQFGVVRREKGKNEVRILTITQKAGANQTISITLDGETKTDISVTNGVDATETANEIAAADYSNIGPGWTARARGNQVTFLARDAGLRNGTYQLSATQGQANKRPEGSFTQTIPGVAAIDHFTPQSEWNIDKFDGTGKTGIALDPTKGNVYQIRWQWLGFGVITYFVENPQTGTLEKVHIEHFPNTSLSTSFANPNLSLHYSAHNTSNTTSMIIRSGSIAGLIDGKEIPFGIRSGVRAEKSVTSDEVPLLTLRNRDIYQGVLNRSLSRINIISYGSDHSQPVELAFYANPTLIGAQFQPVNPYSTMEYDTQATALSGGSYLGSVYIAPRSGDSLVLTSDPTAATLPPGGYFTISARSIGARKNGEVHACFNFIELK